MRACVGWDLHVCRMAPIMNTTNESRTPDIVWRLHLAALPQRVFDAWLSAADHERFWCERSELLHDGSFRQHFVDGTSAICGVERSAAPLHIRFRYFKSRVDIQLDRRDDGTDLTLTATDVEPYEWNDVHAGWLNVLLPFK